MKSNAGFTLIEMAIVITVIALIIGGILVGRSMIRSSEVQATIAQMEHYKQAIGLFKAKYNAFPGDLPNAESLWGTDPAGCPGTYTATARTQTCNGNGDGFIGISLCWIAVSSQFEAFRAWQQLSDAQMIEGAYNGISGTGSTTDYISGVNAPASKLTGGMWQLASYQCTFTMPDHYPENFSDPILYLGVNRPTFGPWDPLLSAPEAKIIDAKLDDGMPASGFVRAFINTPGCETSNSPATAQYTGGDSDAPACALEFVLHTQSPQ